MKAGIGHDVRLLAPISMRSECTNRRISNGGCGVAWCGAAYCTAYCAKTSIPPPPFFSNIKNQASQEHPLASLISRTVSGADLKPAVGSPSYGTESSLVP